jgi:hypothetical protein
MNHTRLRAAVAAAGLLTAGLVSATAHADAAAPRGERAAAVQVSISGKRVITMPSTLRPGVHKFVISSVKGSSFQLLRAKAGYTTQKAAHDINAAFGKNDLKALKRFEANTQFLGGVPSDAGGTGTGWFKVPKGQVWAVDTNQQVTDPAKFVALTVSGEPTGTAFPSAPTVTAIKETVWADKPANIPAKGTLKFKNKSVDNHFVAMAKLKKGKTIADFAAWVDKINNGQQAGPPPIDNSEPGLDSGVLEPGKAMAMKYHVSRGTYVLTCFWPDADMGGQPHAFMGMFRALKVT